MRVFARILSSLLLWPTLASAYAPPPEFIVSRSIKERKSLRSVEWIARITDMKTQTAFKEYLRVEFPSGRLLAAYSGLSDEPYGLHEADSAALSRLGRFWMIVTLDSGGARVRSALSELGVLPGDTSESKLFRSGKSVMWGWGDAVRVFFGKDTFLPMGYSSRSESGSDSLSFESFMLAGNQLQVPKFAAVISGALSYRFEIRSVKVDVSAKAAPVATTRVEVPQVKGWVSLVR